MYEYFNTFNIFNLLNFILNSSIFIIFSLIMYHSWKKYDIVASILFLRRKTIKRKVYTGYLSIVLIFAGNLLYNINVDRLYGLTAPLMVFLGLYSGLFIIFEIYTIIRTVQRNQNQSSFTPKLDDTLKSNLLS